MYTTSARGKVFLHFTENKTNRQLQLSGSFKGGSMRKLDQDLWLMGDTSIAFEEAHNAGDDNPSP